MNPNRSVLRVFKQKRSLLSSKDLEEKEMKIETETETDQQLADAKRLPSFINQPNGIVPCVLKRQQSRIQKDQRRVGAKQRSPSSSVPNFICHPNGIILRIFNQKQSQI